MAVVEVLPILQVIGEIEVMLPSDIQAHLLVEFPFESDAEREKSSDDGNEIRSKERNV